MARRRPEIYQSVHIPAPIGGINSLDPLGAMPISDCPYLFNMVAGGDNGLRTRLGYREWCTGLTGTNDNTVRSVLAFTGSKKNGSQDRLFACTDDGIWDVSASTAAPTRLVTFPTITQDSGWGVAQVMVTSAGHFLLYCDEENGYYTYTESTTTWAKVTAGAGATQINGVDPATFASVCVWKNFACFTQKDTGLAWILPIGTIYGAASSLNVGRLFKHGGDLRSLFNWTGDGGSGIDDRLVGISGGGDVVIYEGTNPFDASAFGVQGVWYVGGVPYGRRVATDFGGDLLILGQTGIVPASQLVLTTTAKTPYVTDKIFNTYSQLVQSARTYKGWSLKLHPNDGTLLVMVPQAGSPATPTQQLAMSLQTRSWSQYRDLPVLSADVWDGDLYFGTHDGKVCKHTDYIDAVLLSDPNSFTPVQFSGLTAFNNLGNGRQKRVHAIRPTFQSLAAQPNFQVAAKFRYDLTELASQTPGSRFTGSTWDSAVWDTAIWSGTPIPYQPVIGACGCGPEVAIAFRGAATARTVLVGFDVLFEQGGFL